jgi:hypothetical protein
MQTLTFLDLAKKVIQEEKRPLSSDEIWEIALSKNYAPLLDSKGKTPAATLGARLYTAARDNKFSIVKVGVRPARFYLSELPLPEGVKATAEKTAIKKTKKLQFLEKHLHPFVAYYANDFLKTYTKTVHHSKSDKKGFGEWIHPDMVGCRFLLGEWSDEVMDLSFAVGNASLKLFSFEIKRDLNFTNLRAAFFQAVSNSSWANEGYLVAANISLDEDFLLELRRLSTSFGIGVIKIDVEEPDSSDTLFPAKTKEYLDWETVNKLAGMNPDFKEFLKRIKTDLTSKEIRREKYDQILEREDLVKLIKNQQVK